MCIRDSLSPLRNSFGANTGNEGKGALSNIGCRMTKSLYNFKDYLGLKAISQLAVV